MWTGSVGYMAMKYCVNTFGPTIVVIRVIITLNNINYIN